MPEPRRKMPVKVLSINLFIGNVSVNLSYESKTRQIAFVPLNLKPAYAYVEKARKTDEKYWDNFLAHQVIYYAVTGHEAPAGDFDYGYFTVDGHDLIMLSKAIRTLVEIGEGNTNEGPIVLGSGRN